MRVSTVVDNDTRIVRKQKTGVRDLPLLAFTLESERTKLVKANNC